MTNPLQKLLEAGRIGGMELKNRAIMAPMGIDYATPDGFVTQRQIDYYAERAGGGAGMVIVEASSVQPSVGKSFYQICLDDDKYIPELSRLAEAIRAGDARPVIQIHHAGAAAHRSLTGVTPVAPSSVLRRGFEKTHALTIEEIKEIIDCFARAAARCRQAGFEAVEIHGSHQYLFAQFLSPLWNERSDEYGGDLRGRARFLIDVVEAIKGKVTDLPVICRLTGEEYGTKGYADVEQGITLEETIELAKMLQECGTDAIHISRFGWGKESLKAMPYLPGEMLPLTEAVKKEVSIPVIAVGSLTPETAEQALVEGKADFIAFGRGLIADPFMIQKAVNEDYGEIMPCIACFNCQSEYIFMNPDANGMRCSVNARAGKEALYPPLIPKTKKAKKVVVIGGGPGGMEAARVCALRGHDVVLIEKEAELGGQLLAAAVPPHKTRIADYTTYLVNQMKRLGVKLKLDEETNEEAVRQLNPDAVILSTGLTPIVPDISGLDQGSFNFATEALAGRCEIGEKVIIIGGSLVGCETADYLTEQDKNRKVAVIEILPRIATKVLVMIRPVLLGRLRSKGVQLLAGATCKEIRPDAVIIADKEGKTQTLPMDTLLIATGGTSNQTLYEELKGKVPEIHLIGDAVEPRRIIDAVHEAFETAYKI
ncbi:FAD-dependent oxidoreductase [Thermodesulfobacteriota bacterium]